MAVSLTPAPTVDDSFMRQTIHIINFDRNWETNRKERKVAKARSINVKATDVSVKLIITTVIHHNWILTDGCENWISIRQ